MNYTDIQLKQALAKMLPDKLETNLFPSTINWRQAAWGGVSVLDTELLHLCWMVEETLTEAQWDDYAHNLCHITNWDSKTNKPVVYHATWQQRTLALAKVKGITL